MINYNLTFNEAIAAGAAGKKISNDYKKDRIFLAYSSCLVSITNRYLWSIDLFQNPLSHEKENRLCEKQQNYQGVAVATLRVILLFCSQSRSFAVYKMGFERGLMKS